MYVSTLQNFVEKPKITARFPEGTVEITQLVDVKKAERLASVEPWCSFLCQGRARGAWTVALALLARRVYDGARFRDQKGIPVKSPN
jgi:hypothetical protein